MDGVRDDNTGVLLLGGTNIPWRLDKAVIRRFERRIYIPLPSAAARKQMFQLQIGATSCNLTAKEYDLLVSKTEG
jgi:vacuolar protein-sorting-associated protein 4